MKSLQVVRSFPAQSRAMAVAFSNDGKLLAMGEQVGRVVVTDAAGAILWSFDTAAGLISLAWSTHADWLAVGGTGQVEVWSVGTRVWVRASAGMSGLSLSWSPEDRLAFCASGDAVGLWYAADTREHLPISVTTMPFEIRWCSDGRLAVGLWDGRIRVIHGDTPAVLSGHTGYVHSLSWSPDKRGLASSSADGTVRIWNPPTAASLTTLSGTGVEEIEWIAEDILAVGTREKVSLVRLSTQQELASWIKGGAIAYKLSLSSSAGLLAVSRADGFYVLDVSEFMDRPREVHSAPLDAWAARQLATVGLRPHPRSASMWVPHFPEASGDCLGCLHGPGTGTGPALDVTADSRELVSGHDGGIIRAWSLTDGSVRWENRVGDPVVFEVALAPDGWSVAVGHGGGTFRLTLLDSRTGKVVWSEEIPGASAYLRWSADGSRLLTRGGTIYNAASGEVLVQANQACLAILPSGRTLQKIDDSLCVCNDRLEPEYPVGEVKQPRLASISPQQDRIAIISRNGTLWICRLPSVQPMRNWQVFTDGRAYPRGLAWSPDGEHLATSIGGSPSTIRVDGDDHIRIWRSATGELVRDFKFPESHAWRVSWSPNGAFIAAGCNGDVIRFFDTRSLCRQPIAETDRSLITPEHAELARNLVRLHRLGVYPPLSTAESAVQMIGGRGPDPALAAEPGVKRLSDLRWSGSARTALAALLIEDVPFAGWAPPEDVSHSEVSDALQQALAGAEPIPPEVPGFPAAPIASAAKQISEPFVRMLDLIGEEAVAEEPSIALHLLKRTPQLPKLPSPKLWRYSERSFSGGGGRSMSMLNVGERGGFGPHGDIQSLLASQWVLPDEVRTYRYLHHELLYRQRLAKAPPRIRPLVVVLDVTAAALGVVEGVTRPAAQVALNRAYEAGVGAWLVLLEGARNRGVEVRSRRDLAQLWTSRGEALGNAADALELARRAKESAGDDGLILVLSHAWFGWDESLPELSGLRGLFVRYPGTRANPKISCEMWETVDAQHPAAVWDKLGELLA